VQPEATTAAATAPATAAAAVQSIGTPALWIGFTVVVVLVLAIDLYIGSKSDAPMTKRTALAWTSVWVTLAAGFCGVVWMLAPQAQANEKAMEFASAYIIEYSLSVDNLFVFLLLFSAFKVPSGYQHRVLFWGIFGAVVLRAIFIFAGTALLARFHFLIYLFGAFLIYTGIKLLTSGEEDEDNDVSDNKVVVLAKRFIAVTDKYDGHNFFTVIDGVRKATPLLLVLVCVELSDVVFALDSIPAVFGITLDPFIVYTSNIFAILGLRSLFFLLAGSLWGLRFLKPALGIVLAFVGVKMCLPLVHWVAEKAGAGDALSWVPHHIPTPVSLGVVAGMLGLGVVLSMVFPGKKPDDVKAAEEVKEDIREVIHPELDPNSGPVKKAPPPEAKGS
jgi:tellurite resistance protein TerC